MPRVNRFILPGHLYDLIRRCHNRSFLLRSAVWRTEYRRRLRDAVLKHRISLLNYSVTYNHVHLLVPARSPGDISRFMHKLEGQFARFYNVRQHRSGAFWQERYRGLWL